MSISHFKSQTVADGTATSVVRPSDWNSAHYMNYALGGNTAGSASVSGADVAFFGGSNVTVSGDTANSRVYFIGPAVGPGFTTTTAGGAVIVGTNNTAGLQLGVPAFLTTAMQSAGSSTLAGTGTTFAGTNVSGSMTLNSAGLNLALSAPAGGGGGAAMVEWEPALPISTVGLSLAQNSLYLNTLTPPHDVNANFMVMGVVMTGGWTTSTPVTNSTATTGSSSSASAGQTLNMWLFTDGAGGAESNLYTNFYTSVTMSTSVSWSQTNSNTTTGTQSIGSTMGFTYGVPMLTSGTVTSVNAASTVTTWGTSTGSFTGSSTFSTNGTSTSGWPGGTSNATWAGSRILFMPFTSFSANEYWLGVQRSSATVGAAVAGTFSFMAQSFSSYDSGSRWAPLGYATSQLPYLSHPGGLVNGIFSTSYNSTSNYAGAFGSAGAIAKSNIAGSATTNTSGTISRFYNRFVNQPF